MKYNNIFHANLQNQKVTWSGNKEREDRRKGGAEM